MKVEDWALADKQSREPVNRLHVIGYRHTLEAEVRLTEIRDVFGRYNFTKVFPEFTVRGRGSWLSRTVMTLGFFVLLPVAFEIEQKFTSPVVCLHQIIIEYTIGTKTVVTVQVRDQYFFLGLVEHWWRHERDTSRQ